MYPLPIYVNLHVSGPRDQAYDFGVEEITVYKAFFSNPIVDVISMRCLLKFLISSKSHMFSLIILPGGLL